MSDQECLMNSLKKDMRSLLIATKEGLTPFQLEQDFRTMIGKQLPYRALGYHSTMELVKDMPDVVNICPQGNGTVILKAIADDATKGIASLVARQKSRHKPQPPRCRLDFCFRSGPHSGLSWRSGLPRQGRVPPTLPAAIRSELKELLRISPVLLSDFNQAFIQRFGRTFEFFRYGFFSMSEVLNAASDIITVEQTRTGSMLMLKKSPSPEKKPVKLPICNVVVQPDKQMQTKQSPVRAPAAKTISPASVLPVENPHVVPNKESNTSHVQLEMESLLMKPDERVKQLEKEFKKALFEKGPGGIVSSELKEKIRMIVAQHPEGLLASKLPIEFEMQFKETLPIRKLGFINLMELIGVLSDVFHIERKEGEQDWLIFDVDSLSVTNNEQAFGEIAQPGSLQHEETSDKHNLPCWDFPLEDSKNQEPEFTIVTKTVIPHLGIEELQLKQEIMEQEIPPDAVRGGSLYRLPEFESSVLVGLFVEHIVSPSQFFVRIRSEETSDKLIDMMIEMKRCYSNKNVTDRYVIPDDLIQPGHLCCVRSSENTWWYRVIVHRVLSEQEVEVFYPDFGNTEVVQKSLLRFLKSCYAKLPAQAIPCSLAWVKPKMDDWTVSATLQFQNLCGLKLLVGVVDEYIDSILYLFLCDTSSNEDIYFHNVLRLEGHAIVCRENIPSKGFQKLNLFSLYLKSSLEGTEADDSVFQLKFPDDLVETTYSEPCSNEVVSQGFDKRDDLASYEPEHLKQNAASLGLDLEMPYLEPVNFCSEIWEEDWILSNYYRKNEEAVDTLDSDAVNVDLQPPNDEGSKKEVQHSQDVVLKKNVDLASVIERETCPQQEQGEIQNSPEGIAQRQNTIGITSGPSSQILEEFYVSIDHSKIPCEPSKIDLDTNIDNSWPLHSTSVFDDTQGGEAPSEKKMDEVFQTKAVTLYNTNSYTDHRAISHNALKFTAELQGSPTFCVPYSPAVALGASARLATSSGCFSLSLRKMNT